MLKPKKKLNTGKVEKEPLVERVEMVEDFIKEHSKILMGALAGLVVVIVIVVLMFRSKAKANKQASGELGIAEISLARGDTSDAVLRLEDLTAQYPGTRSANLANALLGRIAMMRGDYTSAEQHFNTYLHNNKNEDIFTVQVLQGLANCYYMREDYAGAAQQYLEAAKMAPHQFQKNNSLLHAAKCYLVSSDALRAKELITRVKNDKPEEKSIKYLLKTLENQLAAKNI